MMSALDYKMQFLIGLKLPAPPCRCRPTAALFLFSQANSFKPFMSYYYNFLSIITKMIRMSKSIEIGYNSTYNQYR